MSRVNRRVQRLTTAAAPSADNQNAVEKVVRLMGNFVIYTDQVGEYRWYLKADNGRRIADSGEGFRTRQACEDGIRLMKRLAPMAKIDSPRGVETLV